jgi:hypothetical protein
VAPTVNPKNIVTTFINPFCAASDNLPTTPDSLNKFQSISMPIKDATDGSINITIIATTIGKIIFSMGLTYLNCPIL